MSPKRRKHAAIVAVGLMASMMAACATPVSAIATEPQQPGGGFDTGQTAPSPAVADLLTYLRQQNSTGFVVIQDGRVLMNEGWNAPANDAVFGNFVYGQASNGALLEDVASQQKSFVAVLVAIAIDKGLIDVNAPVSTYLGNGWSTATRQQEEAIRVIDILTMSSGLDESFGYEAAPGTTFFYNTPVYAITKDILIRASGQPIDAITRDWLTAPLGMNDTAWRQRPSALASVGNATGLVTTPQDVARFGLMVLSGGLASDGTRVVSEAQLNALFERSVTNPAYGRLWWLNGSDFVMRGQSVRSGGPLIAAAPADLVAALGAFDRKLYVVPSRKLVVVRTGASATDRGFDQQLWTRLMRVID